MLTLYHGPSAANGLKCLATLKEKGLDYKSVFLDLQNFEQHEPWYLEINPEGQVPTLVHDREILRDSSVINEYLEDAFPDTPPLMPADAAGKARVRHWNKYIDEQVMESVSVHGWNTAIHAFANTFSEAAFERFVARIPLKRQRVKWRRAREGFPAGILDDATEKVADSVQRVEAQLEHSPWLAGDAFSLADINYFATAGLGLPRLFPDLATPDRAPRLLDWLERVQSRPAIQAALAVAPMPTPPEP